MLHQQATLSSGFLAEILENVWETPGCGQSLGLSLDQGSACLGHKS